MHIADTLSRAYIADGADSCEQFSQINAVEHLPIGQSTMSLLRTAIAEDGHMQTLKQTILAGWPDNRADVNTDIASYFSMRDELAVHDGLIFRGECVIVPQGMRKHIKKRLHLPHLGADSMVRRARECDFCPGMAAKNANGYPNANGKAESGVKAAKQMMEKCKRSNNDPYMALLEIRNTPTQGVGSSPSQRLINRRTRTLLPMTHNLLRPTGELEHECDKLKVKNNQTMQATYYNRRAKDLPVLKEGDRVRLKPFRLGQKGWNKGTVVARLDERSYDIETPDGMFRRNRVHIRKDTMPEDAAPTAQRSTVHQQEPVVMAPQPM